MGGVYSVAVWELNTDGGIGWEKVASWCVGGDEMAGGSCVYDTSGWFWSRTIRVTLDNGGYFRF